MYDGEREEYWRESYLRWGHQRWSMEQVTFEQRFKGQEVIVHSFILPGSQSALANISLGLFCGLGRAQGSGFPLSSSQVVFPSSGVRIHFDHPGIVSRS